jgi:hypothetical protein
MHLGLMINEVCERRFSGYKAVSEFLPPGKTNNSSEMRGFFSSAQARGQRDGKKQLQKQRQAGPVKGYIPTLRGEAAKDGAPDLFLAGWENNSSSEMWRLLFLLRLWSEGRQKQLQKQRLARKRDTFPPFAMKLRRMGHPIFFGGAGRTTATANAEASLSTSLMVRGTAKAKAEAKAGPEKGYIPTLRDEAAKDGAPDLFWRGWENNSNSKNAEASLSTSLMVRGTVKAKAEAKAGPVKGYIPTLRGEAAKDGAPDLLWRAGEQQQQRNAGFLSRLRLWSEGRLKSE